MIAIYFLGTGVAAAAVGFAPNFTVLAIALLAVGVFAAIYHPVGTPMVIDAAVRRGRALAWNGMWGNVGVSVASGITAAIASILGWRWAFFVPAALFIVSGFAYLLLVPDEGRRQVARASAQDVALDLRLTIAVIALFMLLAVSSGLVFNGLTIALPKIVDARIGHDVPLWLVGGLATAVFLFGAAAQLSMGRLVEYIAPHFLVALIATLQFVAMMWVAQASGWLLLLALALAIAAIYGQVTVNDVVLARYTPPAWRGRVYALRFFIIFTSAGPAVWAIGWLYDRGGFDLVLWIIAMVAAVFALNSLAISALTAGAESRRARALPAE